MRNFVPPPLDPQLTKILGWCLLLGSLPIWFFSLTRVIDKHASESWPSTYGEVLHSEMYKQRRSGRWCLKLNYRYAVDNKVRSSRRLSTSLMSTSACDRDKKVIDARVEKLQSEAKIRVRYKPADPQKAIIYTDDLTGIYFFFAIATILLGCGVKAIREAATKRSP
jgi:hypothetical protein